MSTGSFCDRKRVGRPRSTMKKEDKYIVNNSLQNRRCTAPDLAADFNEHHTTKISTTVKRQLLEVGLRGRVAVKKTTSYNRPQTKKISLGQRTQELDGRRVE